MGRSEANIVSPYVPKVFRVQRLHLELRDTVTLELRADSSYDLPAYRAGQFSMLYAFGVGEIPVSVSGNPSMQEVLVHTIRAVGHVSTALIRLKRGDPVGVRGPYGAAWPLEESRGKDVMIVAGGIGIAPLRSVIYAIASEREAYGKVTVLFGARTPRDLLYSREFDRWRRKFGIDLQCAVDSAETDWAGHVGFVAGLVVRVTMDPERTVAMICGPEIMMKKTAMELEGRGISTGNIYISMERNMKCALGFCGHCQFGPAFICKDGPVFRYSRLEPFLHIREV